jgi:hypothetical protein
VRSCRAKFENRFRWLQCQLDEIAKLKTMKHIREALSSLPEGLHETYENILAKVPTASVRIVRRILQWLICNVSALTLAELHESLAIEPDMDNIDEEAQLSSPMDIYDLCRSLIAVTAEGEVILAHLSVKDYLLSDAIKGGSASAFALSETEANAENALSCLTYLSFAEMRSGPVGSADDFEARLLRHPFLDHASRWWASYARNANSSSEELNKRALQFFSSSCRPQFMSWLQIICSGVILDRKAEYRTPMEYRKRAWDSYPKNATSLYYAASFGLEHVVRALLAQGAEVDAVSGRLGATAFHAAALRGHVQVMDILFQKGADPNRADSIKKTPLHSAALMGNVEASRYLLEHGADPEARDNEWRTPQYWALLAGHVDAQRVIEAATNKRRQVH